MAILLLLPYWWWKDYISAKYLIDNYKNLNLSIKNRYGISGSSFIGLIDKKVFDAME